MTLYKISTKLTNAYLASVKTSEVVNAEKGNKTFLNFVFAVNGETINAWALNEDFAELPLVDLKYDVEITVSSKIGAYNKDSSYLSVRVLNLTPVK